MVSINYRMVLIVMILCVAGLRTTSWAQSGVKPEAPAPPVATQTEEKTKAQPAKNVNAAQSEAIRQQRAAEDEAQQLLYLKNYIEDYRLGPEDVISVEVFGPQVQSIYSQPSIIIPPDGKVNYKLIGQINVRGRTVEDVQKEITEKLNEYIIDPKVTVQLVQSHSMKYIIDGDVAKPAVYEMTRRMTIREAIVNAGGLLPTGDKVNVQIARALPNGEMKMIPVNFKKLEKGEALDEPIVPGDMIFVPGNRFKSIQKWMSIVQGLTWIGMMRRF